jgi:lysophospholipase L1-like esterase
MTRGDASASAPGPPAAGRPRAFRVAAVVLSSALAAGGLEAVLALAGIPNPAEFALDDVPERAEFIAKSAYDVDSKLLWRLHRSASLDIPALGFKGVHTDARGLRGADRDAEWAKSRLRVLCLGDSVTFGLTLADDDTFPAQLERKLRAGAPSDAAAVVLNAGVPGYSCVQGMRLLDELAPLAPDVIVWWFGLNDSKPALGRPDSKLEIEDGRVGGALPPFLRKLRTVRLARSIAARLRGYPTRVSDDETRAAVAALAAREAAGGPATIFVRCPSRLDEKLAQIESIAAALRSCGAARVDGPQDVLSEFLLGPAGSDLVKKVEDRPDGRVAHLGASEYVRTTIDVDELCGRRDFVRRWKTSLDAHVALMPAGALGFKDLFGSMRPTDAFYDCCHLTEDSARVAAESIAARVAEVVARRGVHPR